VLGGGVMRIGEPLFSRLRAIIPSRTVNPYAAEIPIVRRTSARMPAWWAPQRSQ